MFIVVFVTTKDRAEAQKIAKALLDQKLIACANIVDSVQSLFWWEGKIDEAAETLVILKTQQSHFPDLVKAVKSLHSYSVPEVIAMPILDGNKDYLEWVKNSTE